MGFTSKWAWLFCKKGLFQNLIHRVLSKPLLFCLFPELSAVFFQDHGQKNGSRKASAPSHAHPLIEACEGKRQAWAGTDMKLIAEMKHTLYVSKPRKALDYAVCSPFRQRLPISPKRRCPTSHKPYSIRWQAGFPGASTGGNRKTSRLRNGRADGEDRPIWT